MPCLPYSFPMVKCVFGIHSEHDVFDITYIGVFPDFLPAVFYYAKSKYSMSIKIDVIIDNLFGVK